MACIADISYRLIWMKFSKHDFYVCAIRYTQAFSMKNYCGFNTKSYCSDVCGYHRCPQTLAEICRNIGICCSFWAVATREKYPGFILFSNWSPWIFPGEYLYNSFIVWLCALCLLIYRSGYFRSEYGDWKDRIWRFVEAYFCGFAPEALRAL